MTTTFRLPSPGRGMSGPVVMVPKTPILIADDFVNLYFTRGLYAVLPFSTFYSFKNVGVLQ